MMKNLRIGIIGSGMAGLSVGIALTNAGYSEVTVFERDVSFERRRQGYGLTMLQGLSALRKLGVFESVKAIDTPSRAHYIFNSAGDLISFFGTIFWPTASKRTSKHNLHISRQNLRKILYNEYCRLRPDPNIMQWNRKLVGIKLILEESPTWRLHFEHGEPVDVDLVIGCDGINSSVRSYKYESCDDYPLRYLGIILVLGITRTSHYLSQERVFQTVDGNTRLFAMPFYGDEHSLSENIMWQLSFPVEESVAQKLAGNLDLLKTTLLEKCGHWHDPIPALIESTPPTLFTGIPAYDREPYFPENSHIAPGIVLLGDAAHPMSPFKGQGANQALLDGVSFVEHLVQNETSMSDAIRSFEKAMWARVRPKVIDSKERVTTFHESNILNGKCFFYRGVDPEFLQQLRDHQINSTSGDKIEELIIEKMNLWNKS